MRKSLTEMRRMKCEEIMSRIEHLSRIRVELELALNSIATQRHKKHGEAMLAQNERLLRELERMLSILGTGMDSAVSPFARTNHSQPSGIEPPG